MGEAKNYLSQAAVGVVVGRAAVRAVAAPRLLFFVQERRGVRQGILQSLTRTQRKAAEGRERKNNRVEVTDLTDECKCVRTCAEMVRWKVLLVDVSLETLLWGVQ